MPQISQGQTMTLWTSAMCFCSAEIEAHLVSHLSQLMVLCDMCTKVRWLFKSMEDSKFLSQCSHRDSMPLRSSSEGWSLFMWVFKLVGVEKFLPQWSQVWFRFGAIEFQPLMLLVPFLAGRWLMYFSVLILIWFQLASK